MVLCSWVAAGAVSGPLRAGGDAAVQVEQVGAFGLVEL